VSNGQQGSNCVYIDADEAFPNISDNANQPRLLINAFVCFRLLVSQACISQPMMPPRLTIYKKTNEDRTILRLRMSLSILGEEISADVLQTGSRTRLHGVHPVALVVCSIVPFIYLACSLYMTCASLVSLVIPVLLKQEDDSFVWNLHKNDSFQYGLCIKTS
jgi:hypothetical protein